MEKCANPDEHNNFGLPHFPRPASGETHQQKNEYDVKHEGCFEDSHVYFTRKLTEVSFLST